MTGARFSGQAQPAHVLRDLEEKGAKSAGIFFARTPGMLQRGRILVVDDDTTTRNKLAERLRLEGHEVQTAEDGFAALRCLESLEPEVIITSLEMAGMDGLALMQKVAERDPSCVVMVTASPGSVQPAVTAMHHGAADYLLRPVDLGELVLVVARELERKSLRTEAGYLRARISGHYRISNIIGSSPAMQQIFDIVQQVAPSRASVLLNGESGTGKELIAAAIHEHSPRADKPFIKLHCAALAESLLESELFGHERGAFTGAVGRRLGRFEQADGGTLFLDEISEISPAIQVKLLRFLQEQEFERVGGNETVKVNVRLIVATNRNLAERVQQQLFRADLYYRLNVVSIQMPALRDRRSDVLLLATHFLERFATENNKVIGGFTDAALAALRQYDWPGKVRELENAVERAVVVCRGSRIRAQDLAPPIVSQAGNEAPPVPGSSLAEIERHAILKTLEHTGGSTSRAAEILGISARKIQYKLRDFQAAQEKGEATGDGPA